MLLFQVNRMFVERKTRFVKAQIHSQVPPDQSHSATPFEPHDHAGICFDFDFTVSVDTHLANYGGITGPREHSMFSVVNALMESPVRLLNLDEGSAVTFTETMSAY